MKQAEGRWTVGHGARRRLTGFNVALVPPPDNLSGRDPREANREQSEPQNNEQGISNIEGMDDSPQVRFSL